MNEGFLLLYISPAFYYGPRCRSELIDFAWVDIVPGIKCIK